MGLARHPCLINGGGSEAITAMKLKNGIGKYIRLAENGRIEVTKKGAVVSPCFPTK